MKWICYVFANIFTYLSAIFYFILISSTGMSTIITSAVIRTDFAALVNNIFPCAFINIDAK